MTSDNSLQSAFFAPSCRMFVSISWSLHQQPTSSPWPILVVLDWRIYLHIVCLEGNGMDMHLVTSRFLVLGQRRTPTPNLLSTDANFEDASSEHHSTITITLVHSFLRLHHAYIPNIASSPQVCANTIHNSSACRCSCRRLPRHISHPHRRYDMHYYYHHHYP